MIFFCCLHRHLQFLVEVGMLFSVFLAFASAIICFTGNVSGKMKASHKKIMRNLEIILFKIQETNLSLGNYHIFLYAAKNIMKVCNEKGYIKNPQMSIIPNPVQIKAGATHRISISFEHLQEIGNGTKVNLELFIGNTMLPCQPLQVFQYSTY